MMTSDPNDDESVVRALLDLQQAAAGNTVQTSRTADVITIGTLNPSLDENSRILECRDA